MAKQQIQSDQSVDSRVEQLAKELFVQNWCEKSGYTFDHLADQCFKAAEDFYRHSENRTNLQPVG